MMVKVCGITRREDAIAAAEAGASAIGFIFYPKSPRYVTPERAADLGEGLDLWKVGIFVEEKPADIEVVMRAGCLDVAQIYGGEGPQGARIWKAFRVTTAFEALDARDAEAVLLDGVSKDGVSNGTQFDWSVAKNVSGKVIVAGGLDASNVADAIRVARPWGVDASSRLETAPGVKDHNKIRAFVQAALRTEEEAV